MSGRYLLDTNIQAFFPNRSAWRKLERALQGTLDKERFEQLTGRVSLPLKAGNTTGWR